MMDLYSDCSRLSPHQLIALTLRDDSAASIVNRFKDLKAIEEASVEDIAAAGLSHEQAQILKAAIELGRRCVLEVRKKTRIASPRDVFDLIGAEMSGLDREQLRVILLDARNNVIEAEVVSIGSLNSSIAHPREIFKNAIVRGAAGIILTHNHPSGDPTPSPEDVALTKRIGKVGELVGIDLLDHIVIGGGNYCSIRELTK